MDSLVDYDIWISGIVHNLSGTVVGDHIALALSNAKIFGFIVFVYVIQLIVKKNWSGLKSVATLILIVGIVDALCFFILKPWVGRIRPCHALEFFEAVKSCGGKYSYPSNHAANVMAASVYIFAIAPKQIARFFLIISILVGLSRVYLGVHYMGDVLSGFIVGGGISFAIIKLLTKVGRLPQKEP